MNNQSDKLLGLITILIMGILGMIFGFIYNVLPAMVLLVFFGFFLGGAFYVVGLGIIKGLALILGQAFYMSAVGYLNFMGAWAIGIVVILIGIHFNATKAEYNLRVAAEDDE